MPTQTDDTNGYLVRIAILETQITNLKENLTIQAREYERRLTDLNHAHAQSVSDKATYMTKELFDSKHEELIVWKSELDRWRAKLYGFALGIGVAGGLAGGGIAGVLIKLVGK